MAGLLIFGIHGRSFFFTMFLSRGFRIVALWYLWLLSLGRDIVYLTSV